MTSSNTSSNTSNQINIKNNYKYDEFGFLLVNSIEDLLYDKFNNEMEKNINNTDKNYKNKRNNIINSENNKYQSISTDRKIKYILIKKNSYDKIEDYNKENNITNNQDTNYNNIDIVKKITFVDSNKNDDIKNNSVKKKKNFSFIISEKQEELFYEPDPMHVQKKIKKRNKNNINYTIIDEENNETSNNSINENKEKNISINNTSRSIISKLGKRQENIINKENNLFERYNHQNKIFKRFNKCYLFRLPIISHYYMSKIRKKNNLFIKIKNSIPKPKMFFIPKSYSLDKDKFFNIKTKILSLPKSTICYYERNNKILMLNTSKISKNVKNNQFFLTKEIIRHKKENNKDKPKIKPKTIKIKNSRKINNDSESPLIQIKLINTKNPLISYDKPGKIGIKAYWKTIEPQEMDSNKKQKIFLNQKSKNKSNIYENKINKNNYPIFNNNKIRFLLNKSKKNSNLFNKISENIRTKYKDKIEHKIPINNKFKNNIVSNYKMFDSASKNLRKTFNQLLNKKLCINNKRKSLSYINRKNSNIIFFPAIESYFN